jgi:small membrane protein
MTVIKILLILAALALLLLFLRSHGTNRGGAYAKIAMTVFMLFAIYAVLRPDDVTWIASKVGVSRGTDLVLYLLVIGVGFFAISTYLRFKEMELKYARLARAIAIAEAGRRDRDAEIARAIAGHRRDERAAPAGPAPDAPRPVEAFTSDARGDAPAAQ